MILYKYYRRTDWANFILGKNTIRYANPFSYNDPFETSAADFEFSGKTRSLHDFNRRFSIENSSVVFCLTRNPLNNLMWAHYGGSHSGVVVGFDVNVLGLNDFERCVLPCDYGSVIYAKTKPRYNFEHSLNDDVIYCRVKKFNIAYMSALQRMYLYKSQEWFYEEEVRVVRHRLSFDENFVVGSDGNSVVERFPPRAISEIYFGLNFMDIDDPRGWGDAWEYEVGSALDSFPSADVFLVDKEPYGWGLKAKKLGANWQADLADYFFPCD
ncbi:DUF2971 domain-containing protein [Vogesella indigofera]|uniref:DUF2971 domain-containing protein n=1 Tax=Vogesella indigofera TaxID=45465 RepID=UPI00234D787C|nr:DUF2971 domain-containing protein [Vogesella indigofera]MDC7704357.1 DUF2971 domain-containing protein [Vogesella indigofera]